MNEELKPCYCCGEQPVIFKSKRPDGEFCGYFVSCDNFDCAELPESDRFLSEEGAILDWNRRMDNENSR